MAYQDRTSSNRRSQDRRGMYTNYQYYGPERRMSGDRRSAQDRRASY